MAFDEKGQADTFAAQDRHLRSARTRCSPAEVDFPAEDIVFDPNIFAIATGIEEHNNYAVDFINATRWIRQHLPHAKVSGGVSNVSFSFRGNDPVREAIHTVFLYHAIRAGMSMGIVNAGQLGVYDEIPPGAARARRGCGAQSAAGRDRAASSRSPSRSSRRAGRSPRTSRGARGTVEERLSHALVRGITTHIIEDTEEARQNFVRAAGARST